MNRLIYLCALVLFLLPTILFAELPPQLARDLAPVEGTVLMPIGDRYLVDLDAARGVRTGDILAVLTAGERIIDPITRDVVGTRDSVTGYLVVTRVLSGYSYVDILTDGLTLQQGDRIRRFDGVPALSDASVSDELGQVLQQRLPHLDWDAAAAGSVPSLSFRVEDERLVVASHDTSVLFTYPMGTQGFEPLVAVRPVDTVARPRTERSLLNRGVDSVLGTVGLDGLRGDRRLEAPTVTRRDGSAGVWISPPLGDNPIGLAAADLTGDGRVEIVIALQHELRIMRLDDDQFTLVAQVNFPPGTRLLSVDALDMNANGQSELYLTAVSGSNLRSQVVEYRGGSFERTITMVDWFLRVADLPAEGRVLLGQRLGAEENPFRPPVFRVERQGDRLVRGSDLSLPDSVNLFSLLPLTPRLEGGILATITDSDALRVITSAGDRLWDAGEHFGGSDNSFDAQSRTSDPGALVAVQQRLLRLPGGEILAVQNQGSRILQRLRTFTDSQLVAFDWNGAILQEKWRTPLQKGYIADFAVADIDGNGQLELLIAMRFQEKNILQRGHSALVIYNLQ